MALGHVTLACVILRCAVCRVLEVDAFGGAFAIDVLRCGDENSAVQRRAMGRTL